jgi:phage terminase large subunit-like protein
MEKKLAIIRIPVDAFQPHKWHLNILKAFDDKVARFFVLVWHRRSRKTTLALNILIKECIKNPKSMYAYVAPTYVQAKAICWRDPNMLDRYLPKELIKRKNETELYVEFTNGSILAVKGADKPDSLRGTDWSGVVLDEFALMKREIWEEILRPVLSQNQNRWAIFACTPKGVNHAHEYWVKSAEWTGWMRSLLKASESGLLDENELKQARLEMTDALFLQELECSWISREEKSMITSEMIDALENNVIYHEEEKSVVACDPSEGGDECVIHAVHNTKILETLKLHENDSMIIAGEMVSLAYRHGIKNFAVDDIGIGKGIKDRLAEQGHNVQGIRSSEKAFDEEHFYNRRTEMWWHASDLIKRKMVEPIIDFELKGQLVAPKYEVVDSSGKIRLEPKKYTKDLLGRSPDNADCFIYAIWALKFIQDAKQGISRPAYKPQKPSYQPSIYKRRIAHV